MDSEISKKKRPLKNLLEKVDYRFVLQHFAAGLILAKALTQFGYLKYAHLMEGVMKYGIDGACKHGYYLNDAVGYFMMYIFYVPVVSALLASAITAFIMFIRSKRQHRSKLDLLLTIALIIGYCLLGFLKSMYFNTLLLSLGNFFERWGYLYKLLANGILLCLLSILFYVIPLPKPTAKDQAPVLS